MAPFADLPHVACKLSGMVTEADWQAWRMDDLQPYMDAVLGWFLLGVREGLAACYFSSRWKDVVAFGIFIIILVVRPRGLLG